MAGKIKLSEFSGIDIVRVFQYWLNGHPLTIAVLFIKAVMTPCMAGDPAELFDLKQDHVIIAIEPDRFDNLLMTRLLALVP